VPPGPPASSELVEYRPKFAAWVVGRYPRRSFDPEENRWEEQRVDMTCEKCGATWVRHCNSGKPREWIAKFAVAHAHADPLGGIGSGNRGA
jgi:hypothetical protein